MKRFLSILLILCMVLGLVPMALAATELTTVEKAIVETALAYYYKGPAVQYDSYYLGNGGRFTSGILRQTNDRTPESSSADDIHYTVCSAYPWDIYFNAFDDRIIGQQERIDLTPLADHEFATHLSKMGYTEEQLAYEYSIECIGRNYSFLSAALSGKDARSVAYYGPSEWDSSGNVTALSTVGQSAAELEKLMRPGDIITVRPYKIVANGDAAGGDTEDETTDGTESGTDSGTLDGSSHYAPNGGHTMVYLGDVFGDGVTYVIHSWGAKYDNNGTVNQYGPAKTKIRGFDLLEAPYSWKGNGSGNYVGRNGSIVLTPYKNLLGAGKSYDVAKSYDYSVLRPSANKTEADLSDSALFRLDRPGITVTKTADVKPYRDVIVGDEITYTVKIENNTLDTVNSDVVAKGYGAVLPENRNKTYTDLVLTETLPENVYFSYASGDYSTSGQNISWKLPSLAPGASVEVSYTVEVADGQQVVSPDGKLTAAGARGSLPTKTLTHEISPQELPSSKISAITASSVSASSAAKRSGTDVAEDVYAAMGYSLDIPDGQELADLILQEVSFINDSAKRYRTDFQLAEPAALSGTARTLRNMIVPGFVGGARLYTADENLVRTNRTRLLQLEEAFLEPGDVLVYLNGGRSGSTYVRATAIEKTEAYVYLGNSNWAYYNNGTFTVKNDPIKTYYGTTSTVNVMENDSTSYVSGAKSGSKKFTYSEILHQAFLQDVFFLMRPSRVGLSSMTATSNAKAVEVKNASGSAWCADLSSACTAAADGDTVVLHEDVTLPARPVIKKNITLDLNGHSISTTAEDDTLLISGAVCTIKNGTVNGTTYASNSATLTLQNMNLMGRDALHGTDTNYTRYGCALFTTGTATKVEMENVSIASAYTGKAPIQRQNNWNVYGNITVVDDVKIMVPKGVEWDYSTMALGENVKVYPGQGRSLDGKTKSDAYSCVTFTASPDVYNETKDACYASLSEAIATVSHGDTLRLLRDVDTADYDEVGQNYDSSSGATKYMFYCNKTVTLDLDGHTVRDAISNSGTFMLRDDTTSGGLSTFTVKNGTLLSEVYAISGGQVVVQNMLIRSDTCPIYLAAGGNTAQTALVENCVLLGGFGGKGSGSALSCSRGTVTVRNSTLLSNNYQTLMAGTGGATYPGSSDAYYFGKILLEDVKVYTQPYTYNIYGSTGLGVLAGNHIGPADRYGLLSSMQMATYTIDGKAMPFLMDTYGVTDPVATVNGAKYASVERAIENLQSGETALLAANATLTEDVTVPENTTLDVGDYTLTLSGDAAMTVAGTVTAGESGSVAASGGQVKLEGKGNYLGITIPKGVEGTVYADPTLTAEYDIAVGGTLTISGTAAGACTVLDAQGETLAETESGTFSLGSVAAKEMNKEFSVVLTAAAEDGTYVGRPAAICLRTCAEQALENIDWATDADTGRALVALLNYGAAAQSHFGYDAENLANANIGKYQSYLDMDPAAIRVDSSSITGKTELLRGTSCVLGESLQMKIYAAEGTTFDVTYKGETVSGLAGGKGYVLQDISLADMDTPFTVTVYESGVPVARGTDSPASYLARLHASGKSSLADAILTYALAVKALS